MRQLQALIYRRLAGVLTAALLLAGCGSASDQITPTALPPASTQPAATALAVQTLPPAPAATDPAPAISPTPGEGPLALAPCQLSAHGRGERLSAECGTLLVPENPADPAGRQVGLRVAVVRARGRSPAPDPLFFLTGGPGQAASESFVRISFAFKELNNQRDIVLVDQRGTGQSNPLECPLAEDPLQIDTLAEIADGAAACLAQLEGDPRFYTTAIAMDDLDRVRAALGYEQINLYGASYGTRAALTYLRQDPGRVRAAVLDGVVPPEQPLGLYVARDAQRALDLIFARCAVEPACQAAFPDLPAEFSALADRLDAAPAPVALEHPLTGEPVTFDLTNDAFASTIRLLSYSPETVALLPLLIHTTHEQDDFRLLAAQSLIGGSQLAEEISEGMSTAVLCSEDAPFITPAEAEAANAGTYLRGAQTDQLAVVCPRWPAGAIPADFKAPVSVDVPVLLLSGEADPVTPPANGEQVAASLPNSLHLVAPSQGHNIVMRGCLPRLARDFIERGHLEGLETDCVKAIAPLPFFTRFTGPPP
jgi:pimeloyl-ACP methyl ester carboxylesterase